MTHDPNLAEILDTRQAAAYVNLSAVTLERLRITGEGAPFLKLGKSVRYRRTDLAQWLSSKVINSTSQTVKG